MNELNRFIAILRENGATEIQVQIVSSGMKERLFENRYPFHISK